MFRSYTLPEEHGIHGHFLVADASGDSAVIETEALKTLAGPSADSIRPILSSVAWAVAGKEAGTLYSNLYDLRNREVVVYFKRAFDKPRKFKLNKELDKGGHSVELRSPGPTQSEATRAPNRQGRERSRLPECKSWRSPDRATPDGGRHVYRGYPAAARPASTRQPRPDVVAS